MSRYVDPVSLRHMLDHAREAVQLVHGKTRSDLDSDRLLNLALARLLEVVGEAATRVSASFQQAHPEVPWPLIIGLRNRLIQGYDQVDFDIMWIIIEEDLPPLIRSLESILKEEFQ